MNSQQQPQPQMQVASIRTEQRAYVSRGRGGGRGGSWQRNAPMGQQNYGGNYGPKMSGGGGGGYRSYPPRQNIYLQNQSLPNQMMNPNQIMPNGVMSNPVNQFPGSSPPFIEENPASNALLPSPQNGPGQVMGNWQAGPMPSSGMQSPMEPNLDSPPISSSDSGMAYSPTQMTPMQPVQYNPNYFNYMQPPQNPYGFCPPPGPYYPIPVPPNAYLMSPQFMPTNFGGPAFPGGGSYVTMPPQQILYICSQCRQATTQPPPQDQAVEVSSNCGDQPQ